MFIESLEPRTLMSATPVSQTVAADRLEVQAALLKFRADIATQCAILTQDCAALQRDDVKQDATLAPLFKQLHTDVAAMNAQLAADRLTEKENVLTDQSVILTEDVQILKDKGNKTAEAADHQALLADQIKLQDDEIAGLDSRLTTRQTDYTIIFSDLGAIMTALGNDSGATAKTKADAAKFVGDKTNALNVFAGDLQNIITARTKLVTDLEAEETGSPAT